LAAWCLMAAMCCDPEGLEHAVCASPTQLLENGLVFTNGLGPQDVIRPTLRRIRVDLYTKEPVSKHKMKCESQIET
jgi:hypothetical protein